ncbi:MAG: hypothetical protein ACRDWV_08475 [Acidimicrobiales bacterium]
MSLAPVVVGVVPEDGDATLPVWPMSPVPEIVVAVGEPVVPAVVAPRRVSTAAMPALIEARDLSVLAMLAPIPASSLAA